MRDAMTAIVLSVLILFVATPYVWAEEPAEEEEQAPAFESAQGPLLGALGKIAQIQVPSGHAFVDQRGMPAFNRATGNLDSSQDLGALFPTEGGDWVAFFLFDPTGYVKDEDKDLDADELLSTFRSSDGPANEQRRRQGMPELVTVDWSSKPHYDSVTHNLTWGLKLKSGGTENLINHQIRILGRTGVLSVIIADSPENIVQSVTDFETVLAGVEFVAGQKYSEFKSGDKIAEYGLAGLMLGGGGLLAAKTGLLAKLGKFIKVIVIGVIALFAMLGKFFKNLFGGRRGKPAQA